MKYHSGGNPASWCIEALVSQNIDAVTGTLRLNRFDIADSLCCMYLIDRFSHLLRCEVALHFINT